MYGCLSKWMCLPLLILCLQLLHVAHGELETNAENLLCTQVLTTHLLDKCCGNLKPSNLLFTSSDCKNFKDEYDVCRYECVFKQWGLLNPNNTLNMSNVKSMIDNVYNFESGYASYGRVLKAAYESCNNLSETFSELVPAFSSMPKAEVVGGEKCNNMPMTYSKCASSKVFLDCPAQLWQRTNDDCIMGLQLLSDCLGFFNELDLKARAKSRSNSATSLRLRVRRRQPTNHWYTAFFNWLVF